MSLSVNGIWEAGVWATTVWADGVWFEHTGLDIDGKVHGNAGSATSVAVSLTTTKSHNIIVVVVTANRAPVTGVSDADGLTWTKHVATLDSFNSIEIWTALASSPLTNDLITVTQGSSGFMTVDAFGVSGPNITAIFDANASIPSKNITDTDLVISTDTADTFIIGGYRYRTQANPTEGTGFTKISGANFQLAEYKIVSSTQTNLAITQGAADERNGGVATAIIAAVASATAAPVFNQVKVVLVGKLMQRR